MRRRRFPTLRPVSDSGQGRTRRFVCRWHLFTAALILVTALAVVGQRYRLVLVIGASMKPTYSTGTLLIVDRRAYDDRDPERGEIVVARYRGELIVKRVVGLPGEMVELIEGALYINGEADPERGYQTVGSELEIWPGRLTSGRFAIVGDNRDLPPMLTVSAVVPREHIFGRVLYSATPLPALGCSSRE